jgi:phosphate transport system protein
MTEVPVPPVSAPQEHRLRFHQQLEEVVNDIVRLGAMVCQTVPRGTEVLLGGELHEAQRLIEGDDIIDSLSVSIEERCYSIMARQAPMAGELRRLITITKLVAELERSADLMVNVSKAARRMYGAPMSPKVRGVVAAMSHEAHRLLSLSIDAFVDENEALASALDDIDDQLDQLNRDMVEAIFDAHAAGDIDLQSAVQLALVARYYERIGDHAVNIGQRVTYMITGWLPEHAGGPDTDERDQSIASQAGSATSEPSGSDGAEPQGVEES